MALSSSCTSVIYCPLNHWRATTRRESYGKNMAKISDLTRFGQFMLAELHVGRYIKVWEPIYLTTKETKARQGRAGVNRGERYRKLQSEFVWSGSARAAAECQTPDLSD
jgi:hypothetical protein